MPRYQLTVRGETRLWAIEIADLPRSTVARMRCDGLVIDEIAETVDATPDEAAAITDAVKSITK